MTSVIKKFFMILIVFAGIQNAQSIDDYTSGSSGPEKLLTSLSVTIGGDFITNGTFAAIANERVDQFITRIYEQAKYANFTIQNPNAINEIKNHKEYAKRNILLIRANGEKLKLDLAKFRLTGDFESNPYLKNGDVLIFPAFDTFRNYYEMLGAINSPGKYQFIEGDKLSDAIFYAMGINHAYGDVTTAKVFRYDETGKLETFNVGINEGFELQPGDKIRVLAKNFKSLDSRIIIVGEAEPQGEYFITENSTTLSSVVENLDGFTEDADLGSAVIIRDKKFIESIKADNLKRDFLDEELAGQQASFMEDLQKKIEFYRVSRQSSLMVQDTSQFRLDYEVKLFDDEIQIDLNKLTDPGSFEHDFRLQDGDILYVPPKPTSVYVFGQVKRTGFYPFRDSVSYKYYINLAGGLSLYSHDEDEFVLIKAKSFEWVYLEDGNYKIEPGDYIYVPKDRRRDFWEYLGRISIIASIVSSAATVYLLFR